MRAEKDEVAERRSDSRGEMVLFDEDTLENRIDKETGKGPCNTLHRLRRARKVTSWRARRPLQAI